MPRQRIEVEAEFDDETISDDSEVVEVEAKFDEDEHDADFAERLEAGFDLLHPEDHDEPSHNPKWWTRRNR